MRHDAVNEQLDGELIFSSLGLNALASCVIPLPETGKVLRWSQAIATPRNTMITVRRTQKYNLNHRILYHGLRYLPCQILRPRFLDRLSREFLKFLHTNSVHHQSFQAQRHSYPNTETIHTRSRLYNVW